MGMIHFPSSSLGPILYSPCILLEYVFSDFAHIILVQREISLGCPVLAVFYRYGQYFGKNVIKDCSGRVLAMDFSRDCSRSSGQHSWEGLGHAMLCCAMLCPVKNNFVAFYRLCSAMLWRHPSGEDYFVKSRDSKTLSKQIWDLE